MGGGEALDFVLNQGAIVKDIVILEWMYLPTDFFGEPCKINRLDSEISIDNGKVTAKVPSDR